MSRDFIGSQEGRSFRQSPNRDRVTRGVQLFPFFSSIRYLHTRWGAFEWCLGGSGAPASPVISGTRYRRIRIVHTWPANGSIQAGRREDLIEYGDGLTDPSVTKVTANTPFENVYPSANAVEVSATSTERILNLGLISTPGGLVFGTQRTIALEDAESTFADTFKADSYADFAGMANFQHRTRYLDSFGTEIFDDRAYWSRGPLTWTTQPDPALARATRVTESFAAPQISSTLTHHPAAEKRYVELGLGSDIFIGPRPPGNGAVARLSAQTNNNNIVSVTVTPPTLPFPQNFFPAGGVKIEERLIFGGFFWQMDLTKVNMQSSSGLVQRFGKNIGQDGSPAFTQFDLSQQPLPGGILEPPEREQLAYYGLNGFVFYYSRILIPPYALLP